MSWGELQDLEPVRQRARRPRRAARRPRRDAAAADARDGGGVLRDLEARRDPALDVGPVRRRGHPPPADRLAGEGARHQRRQRRPDRALAGRARPDPRRRAAEQRARPRSTTVDTAADDPAQLYYSSGTTGLAKGILHAHRYILAHEEFIYCHDVRDGELFHGMGEWAWAAGICPLIGPWRFGAVQVVYQREGGFDPAQAARLPLAPRRHQRVRDADRDPLDDVDRRRRHPLPAEVPDRLLGRRAAEPGGDPLVPRAVRHHRARLLRPDRVLSAVRELPLHGGPRGVDGQADAGLGGGDPRRGRAARCAGRARRDLPARRAPTRTIRSATGTARGGHRGGVRRRLVPHQGRRQHATRTATSGTRAAPTT